VALLSVHDLSKSFGGVHAVAGVSFAVEPGEAVAIIGPNGAGKTTCFNMLGGQLRPDGGRIMVDGRDIAGRPPHVMWRFGIGRTFQVAAIFRSMSVREHMQVTLLSHRRRLNRLWQPLKKQMIAEADDILARVGLIGEAETSAAALAYADLKRLELAIALANQPRLLLLDEPTAGMAAGERHALMDLAGSLVHRQGISMLFTEHDMDVVFGHAGRVIVLHHGAVVAAGAPEQIRADAMVQEIYLGTGIGIGTGSRAGIATGPDPGAQRF
jgi:branched-chain amino acid transport system ATP-binding protein